MHELYTEKKTNEYLTFLTACVREISRWMNVFTTLILQASPLLAVLWIISHTISVQSAVAMKSVIGQIHICLYIIATFLGYFNVTVIRLCTGILKRKLAWRWLMCVETCNFNKHQNLVLLMVFVDVLITNIVTSVDIYVCINVENLNAFLVNMFLWIRLSFKLWY